MALISPTPLSLLDRLQRMDPQGSVSRVVEMLTQRNPLFGPPATMRRKGKAYLSRRVYEWAFSMWRDELSQKQIVAMEMWLEGYNKSEIGEVLREMRLTVAEYASGESALLSVKAALRRRLAGKRCLPRHKPPLRRMTVDQVRVCIDQMLENFR